MQDYCQYMAKIMFVDNETGWSTAECLARYQVSRCEIRDIETGTGIVFYMKTSISPVNYRSILIHLPTVQTPTSKLNKKITSSKNFLPE